MRPSDSDTPLFPSFFLGGFECSTHRRHDGRRLDLVDSTRHDVLAVSDYEALASFGIRGARDGVRWHLVEAIPGQYDWSSLVPQVLAAKRAGVRVAWDLFHYGYPDHLDIFGSDFVETLARFAAAATRKIFELEGRPPIVTPVNEISFLAWAAGQVGYFAPHAQHRGLELKRRLVEASLATGRAARAAVPGTRLLVVDPLIHVTPRTPADAPIAEAARGFQWEAWDALLGRFWPELGGAADGFDVMGVNYYWNNHWDRHGEEGRTIRIGNPLHRPMRELLVEAYDRVGYPILLAETSIESSPRPAWLRYVGDEVRAAMRAGVPIQGICLYPVLSHLGWDNDRYCSNGLLEMGDGTAPRPVDAPLAAELRRQTGLFDAFRRGEDVPEDPEAAESFAEAFDREEKTLLAATLPQIPAE